MKLSVFKILALYLFSFNCHAQSAIETFLKPSDTLNINRQNTVIIGATSAATVALASLGAVWYSDYDKTSFHFIDDNSHWLQMDKAGHMYSAYHLTRSGSDLFRWSGMSKHRSAVFGAISGFVVLSAVEVLDGFSAEWGASTGDIFANASGSGLYVLQEILWKEQRITPKFSYHPTKYAAVRPNILGHNLQEQLLKDYNGQTYWLSVNLHAFIKAESIPKFINIAFGYGADGMTSGRQSEVIVEGNETTRNRRFYLSIDLDLAKIETNSHILKTLFSVLNTVKIPAPTFELTDNGRVKGHVFYF